MRRAILLVLVLGLAVVGWLWYQGQRETTTAPAWSEEVGDL